MMMTMWTLANIGCRASKKTETLPHGAVLLAVALIFSAAVDKSPLGATSPTTGFLKPRSTSVGLMLLPTADIGSSQHSTDREGCAGFLSPRHRCPALEVRDRQEQLQNTEGMPTRPSDPTKGSPPAGVSAGLALRGKLDVEKGDRVGSMGRLVAAERSSGSGVVGGFLCISGFLVFLRLAYRAGLAAGIAYSSEFQGWPTYGKPFAISSWMCCRGLKLVLAAPNSKQQQ